MPSIQKNKWFFQIQIWAIQYQNFTGQLSANSSPSLQSFARPSINWCKRQQLVSIFITMSLNRTLSPAWLAAGCHVPCPSTYGHSITHDYKSTERTTPGVWDVLSFCSPGTALQLFLCTPSQIHSKPEQVHMTVKLQQLKMEHGISCQQEGCSPLNCYWNSLAYVTHLSIFSSTRGIHHTTQFIDIV